MDDVPTSSSTTTVEWQAEHTRFIYQTIIDLSGQGKELCTPQKLHARLKELAQAQFGAEFTTAQVRNVLSNLLKKNNKFEAISAANEAEVARCAAEYDAALADQQRRISQARTRRDKTSSSRSIAASPAKAGNTHSIGVHITRAECHEGVHTDESGR